MEKDLGFLVDETLDMTWQCTVTAAWPAGPEREFSSSAVVRPHLECCVQVWDPQDRKEVNLLEQFQRRAVNTIQGLEHLSCKNRLREQGLFSSHPVLKGGLRKEGE